MLNSIPNWLQIDLVFFFSSTLTFIHLCVVTIMEKNKNETKKHTPRLHRNLASMFPFFLVRSSLNILWSWQNSHHLHICGDHLDIFQIYASDRWLLVWYIKRKQRKWMASVCISDLDGFIKWQKKTKKRSTRRRTKQKWPFFPSLIWWNRTIDVHVCVRVRAPDLKDNCGNLRQFLVRISRFKMHIIACPRKFTTHCCSIQRLLLLRRWPLLLLLCIRRKIVSSLNS